MKTPEQKIADLEDKIARIKEQKRKADAGRKIVWGGAVLAEALKNPKMAKWLLSLAENQITRKVDQDRIEADLVKLREVASRSDLI